MSPATDTPPAPWMLKAEPEFIISRFSCQVVDDVGDDVATVYGSTYEQCLQRAALLVNISLAMVTATANNVDGLPLPGMSVRILVDNPNDAELAQGELATVIAKPQDADMFGDTSGTLWVEGADGAHWGIDADGKGVLWEEVLPDA